MDRECRSVKRVVGASRPLPVGYNMQKRLCWSIERQGWTAEQALVSLTNKSSFLVRSSSGRRVWRQSGERFAPARSTDHTTESKSSVTFGHNNADFPILADVVEVKTGSGSTAHWSIHFIRLNGWLRHSFAQLITLLDIDGIGQNWEDSNSSSKLRLLVYGSHWVGTVQYPLRARHRSINSCARWGPLHKRHPQGRVVDGSRRGAVARS